jgi:hypothetical protein
VLTIPALIVLLGHKIFDVISAAISVLSDSAKPGERHPHVIQASLMLI